MRSAPAIGTVASLSTVFPEWLGVRLHKSRTRAGSDSLYGWGYSMMIGIFSLLEKYCKPERQSDCNLIAVVYEVMQQSASLRILARLLFCWSCGRALHNEGWIWATWLSQWCFSYSYRNHRAWMGCLRFGHHSAGTIHRHWMHLYLQVHSSRYFLWCTCWRNCRERSFCSCAVASPRVR